MTAQEREFKAQTEREGEETTADADPARLKLERTLAFVVVFLGILLVAGLVAVAARIIYLSSQGPAQPTQEALSKTVAGAPLHPAAGLGARSFALPEGAEIKSIALDGAKLAIHYSGPAGTGILIVDQATGETLQHLTATPGAR